MSQNSMIIFNSEEVRKQIIRAVEAKFRSPLLTEIGNPQFHFGGKVKRDQKGEVDTKNIDYSKIPPRLWLVKEDADVYLLGNAKDEIYKCNDIEPAFAYTLSSTGKSRLTKQDADLLLGKGRVWMALPTEIFINPIRRSREYVALEIREKPLSMFERIRRAAGEMMSKQNGIQTVSVALNA